MSHTMSHTVEFIDARYLEHAAWTPGLIVMSRPVQIERRINVRREVDRVEQLLRAAFSL